MQRNGKRTGLAMSVPAGLTTGAAAALAATLICSVVLGKLIESRRIPMDCTGYYVMGMLVVAAFMAAKISVSRIKHRKLLVCMASGGIYWGSLLCLTALFFGGQYAAVGETLALILAGSTLAMLTARPYAKRKSYRKV